MKFGERIFDELILSLGRSSIRRGPDGIPTAVRLLAPGLMSLTIDGEQISGKVEPEDIRQILSYYALKGELVPVDCEHVLRLLADARGIEEAELVKTEPLLGEQAAAGMASLREENGELWAHFEKWSGRARELLSAEGDKLYGYFSPVLRGLKSGPLRVTSLALTNTPAINQQELLAASDAGKHGTRATAIETPRRQAGGGAHMDWLQKLAELLGLDVAAMTAEKADHAPLFQRAAEKIRDLTAAVDGFRGDVADALGLKQDAELKLFSGRVLSVLEKAKGDDAALKDLTTRLGALEGKEKARYIADLKAAGKLTEALAAWAEKQDMAALTEWAKSAPVVVQPLRLIRRDDLPADDDALALSDADIEVALLCGLDPAAVAKANGLKAPAA